MLCAIYKSKRKPGCYLYISKRDDFSAVPDILMQSFGKPQFLMPFNLKGSKSLVHADKDEIMEKITQQGFSIFSSKNSFRIDRTFKRRIKMSSFFVAGTDTDVGKTTACRAIIQALQAKGVRIVGYKPIACSCEEGIYPVENQSNESQTDYDAENNSDVLALMDATNEPVSYQEVNSYTFAHSLPMLTRDKSRIKLSKINQALTILVQKYQSVVVEGSFGLLTPMAEGKSFADWVVEHKMPVVLVVGIKEGCINHALLTAQVIKQLGVPLLGWIANRINPCLGHYKEVVDILEAQIDAPLLGKIPYIHKPESQELGHYLTNIDRLMYMQTELVK